MREHLQSKAELLRLHEYWHFLLDIIRHVWWLEISDYSGVFPAYRSSGVLVGAVL